MTEPQLSNLQPKRKTTMFKGKKSYDKELKSHDVALDRKKPEPPARELDPEKLDAEPKRKPRK